MRATLLLLAAWSLCAASIHGVAKDETGKPVPDITIQLGQSKEFAMKELTIVMNPATAITDENGVYFFRDVSPGKVFVSACTKPVLTHTVQIVEGQDLTVDFLIPSSPTISGRVVTEEKEPVVDAFVWLIASDYRNGSLHRSKIGPEITRTDGTFDFDKNLEPNRTYYLLVDRPAPDDAATHDPVPLEQRERIDAPTYYGDAISLEAATPMSLRPGEHREQMEIKIRQAATYCVDGDVDLAGHAGLQGLFIEELAISSTQLAHARFDPAEDGAFHVCDLTPGQYAISTLEGRGLVDFSIANADVHRVHVNLEAASLHLQLSWDGDPPPEPEKRQPRETMSLSVSLPQDTDTKSEAFEAGLKAALAALRGTEGRAITVTLAAAGSTNRWPKTAAAPFDGPFGSELAAGDYQIETHVTPGAYIKEMSYDGIAMNDSGLHLAPGTTGTLRVIATQGGGTIACKVVDGDGKPVPEASIAIVPAGVTTAALFSREAQQSQTDAAGTFTSSTLRPGSYRVVALTGSYRLIPEDIDKLLLVLSQAEQVEVTARNTVQVTLHAIAIE